MEKYLEECVITTDVLSGDNIEYRYTIHGWEHFKDSKWNFLKISTKFDHYYYEESKAVGKVPVIDHYFDGGNRKVDVIRYQ